MHCMWTKDNVYLCPHLRLRGVARLVNENYIEQGHGFRKPQHTGGGAHGDHYPIGG